MSYIEVEMNDEKLVFEYDRKSIIEMEKMGYNAIHPSEKLYTNFEILIYGGLLKHQPKMKWDKAVEVIDFMKKEYGMMETIQKLSDMVNDVFTLEGTSKKTLEVKKSTLA